MNGQLIQANGKSASHLFGTGFDGVGALSANTYTTDQPAKSALEPHGGQEVKSSLSSATDNRRSLSTDEKCALQQCEEIISRGWSVFLEVGQALAKIRNAHLYRPEFKTFEVYCSEKWQYRKAHVYRLIAASEIVTQMSPIGDSYPKNEAQVRPLIGLSKELIDQAWKKAVESADGHTVTAKHVKTAVASLVPSMAGKKKSVKSAVPVNPGSLSIVEHLEKAMECIDSLQFLFVKGGSHAENTIRMIGIVKGNLQAIQLKLKSERGL